MVQCSEVELEMLHSIKIAPIACKGKAGGVCVGSCAPSPAIAQCVMLSINN